MRRASAVSDGGWQLSLRAASPELPKASLVTSNAGAQHAGSASPTGKAAARGGAGALDDPCVLIIVLSGSCSIVSEDTIGLLGGAGGKANPSIKHCAVGIICHVTNIHRKKHESDLARQVVFRRSTARHVAVDLRSLLNTDDDDQLRAPEHVDVDPLLRGVCDGSPVSIPIAHQHGSLNVLAQPHVTWPTSRRMIDMHGFTPCVSHLRKIR